MYVRRVDVAAVGSEAEIDLGTVRAMNVFLFEQRCVVIFLL